MNTEEKRVPVCVFTKPPLPGLTKTRLARELGVVQSAQLARAFFQDTWSLVNELHWARPILASTVADTSVFGLPDDSEVWLQGHGNLGERMERVLSRGLVEAGRVLLIGADIPCLPAAHLDSAREALETSDAVLGPSLDGGFYLVGLSRLVNGLFDALPWSAPDTLARTEEQLDRLGLSLARAPGWFDIDELDDLKRLKQVIALTPNAAPYTRSALSRTFLCESP